MAQITAGRVVYKRTLQPQPFESKGAEVEFSFTVEDKEDPQSAANEALAMAKAEVHAALAIGKGTAMRERGA